MMFGAVGLTEVTEASVQSGVTQTRSVGSVAAPVIRTVTLLVALLPIGALRTTCTQGRKKNKTHITSKVITKKQIKEITF